MALTKEQIVTAAIELLDEEGLDGLNMRALGKRLGVVATAMYWHVGNKDQLMLLAGDEVWNEIELPRPDDQDWRGPATALATGLYAMLMRHPWLVPAFGAYLFYGEGKARYDDRCLAVYEAGGLSGPEADIAAAAVFTYVFGNALGSSATKSLTRRLARNGDDPEKLIEETVSKATEVAMRFPHLRRRLDSEAAGYNAAPADTFEQGLRALLDGLHSAH